MLDGADSQYSGMQIGQPQDEDEEAAGILPEEDVDAFRNSAAGTWTSAVRYGAVLFSTPTSQFYRGFLEDVLVF